MESNEDERGKRNKRKSGLREEQNFFKSSQEPLFHNVDKVMKQFHHDNNSSFKATSIMNSFVNDTFKWIIGEASCLAHDNKRHNISFWEIQTIACLLLPGELVKHAVSGGAKAVTKYTSSKEICAMH
ncbi:histone H2B, gonadal-like [Heterodontus francisci]|uniref:histone H2B, gonadal-like n=1 Tax=Heterodontus francisci TaxID=7792 RepID=UPI00355BEE1F